MFLLSILILLVLCASLLSFPTSYPALLFFHLTPLSHRVLPPSASHDNFLPPSNWDWSRPSLSFLVKLQVYMSLLWIFWALGLISTYKWVHSIRVYFCLCYFTQDDIFYFHPFAYGLLIVSCNSLRDFCVSFIRASTCLLVLSCISLRELFMSFLKSSIIIRNC